MPEYRHPRADDDSGGPAPSAVHLSRGETAAVDDDGRFTAPYRVGEAVAASHGLDESDIRVDGDDGDSDDGATDDTPDNCDAIKADGEVCGRELPCPYHTNTEDD